MNTKVTYRFRIEKAHLTRRLQKHCCKISGVWVEYEFETAAHIPHIGNRVNGLSIELRVYDVQYYVCGKPDSTLDQHHSVLIECMMTEFVDQATLVKGGSPFVPRKNKVTKGDLQYCLTFGWKIKGIELKHLE